jgi:hypothetical protein
MLQANPFARSALLRWLAGAGTQCCPLLRRVNRALLILAAAFDVLPPLWQHDPGVGNLSDWEAHYGEVSPPLAADAKAVPEPASLAIAALGTILTMGGSRGRRQDAASRACPPS